MTRQPGFLVLFFTHPLWRPSSLIEERGRASSNSNSVGGEVDLVRETRATGLSSLSHPNCPKIGQIRSETSLNNMPFHPQMYCNVQIFTYEVA